MDSSSTARLPFRDASLPVEQRVEDLLGRMTLPEKAGLLFHNIITTGPGGQLATEYDQLHSVLPTAELLQAKHMSHFNLLGVVATARETAEWHNRLQAAAQQTRLGIPVTVSSDPRHHFADNVGTGFRAGALSQWPETLGLAALQSPDLVAQFADVARQEYAALGLRVALHPQVDLATEPRWARIGKTFGEDADLASRLVDAYVRGFQGPGPSLGPTSVATMTKHFPGGGPQKDGEDPHFAYGREQVYPGGRFDYHVKPFRAAIAAGTSQIMPYYGLPVDDEHEPVGFGFNKGIITDLLRCQLGFTGIVCTDWGLVTDSYAAGQFLPARAWGAEHLSERDRVKKILDAGCDQLGGESRPELVVELVEAGLVPESRIDASARRLLREKFLLGLFEQPFVDVDAAVATVGRADFVELGLAAQRRAFTLLTNRDRLLPLSVERTPKVYVEGIDPALVTARGLRVVDTPADADVALLRLRAPFEPRPGGFESRFHAGSLAFPAEEQARQAAIYAAVPTIVDVYLDRPAVLPQIARDAAALLVSYGSSATALLDVVLGDAAPEGRLPFDLPASMAAVEASRSDTPYDTKDPVFRFGHGLRYDS